MDVGTILSLDSIVETLIGVQSMKIPLDSLNAIGVSQLKM
jgi:hypothetical protein